MKYPFSYLTFLLFFISFTYIENAQSQSCSISVGHQYPTGTYSASSPGTWYTVSTLMNGGNWTLFNVTPCSTYEWTYCSGYGDGGSENFDAELTLYDYTNGSTGAFEGYSNNSGLGNCPNAPLITWTCPSNVTKVQLLTTQSGCLANTGASYNSTLVWQEQSAGQAPSPPTSVSATPQTYCAGDGGSVTLQLTGSLSNGASWVWYANSCGGTQVGTSANVFNIVPTQTTTYYARAESSCGNSSCLSTTVTVIPQPSASTPIVSPNPVCPGQTFTLNANATGSPYEWSFNISTYLGNSQNLTENTSTYGSGSYCYTYTANGCQSAQGCVSVTVASPPTITFAQDGQLYLCSSGANSSLTLQAEGGQTYVWSPGTGLSSTTVSNPTVSNLSSTTLYTVTGTDNNGCTGSNSVNVNVTQTPSNISINPSSTSICTGGSGTTLTVNGTAQSYSWSPSNGLSGTSTQSVTANPSSTTTYSVTASNIGSNLTCSATASSTVSVSTSTQASISPPNPSITCSSGNVTLTATPTGTGYSWSGPNGFSSTSASVSVSAIGQYGVTITDAGGCGTSETASDTVTCATGIEEIQTIHNLNIVPNPSSGSFTISFTANQAKEIQIKIYDIAGQVVRTQGPIKVAGFYSVQLTLENVDKGIYILQIQAGEETENRRIEIQ